MVVTEFVGPPGAGKTTVLNAVLRDGEPGWAHLRTRGELSGVRLASKALVSMPAFMSHLRGFAPPKARRFLQMVQLEGMSACVAHLERERRVVLFDQGPVFLLAILHKAAFTGEGRAGRLFQSYWDRTVDYWAGTLSLVIELEVAGTVSYSRIQQRGTRHPVLLRTLEEAEKHFARFRESRRCVLDELRARNPQLRIEPLDAETLDVAAMASCARRCIDEVRGAVTGPRCETRR